MFNGALKFCSMDFYYYFIRARYVNQENIYFLFFIFKECTYCIKECPICTQLFL